MKKLNIFYMGEKLCEVYPHATKWQVFKFKVRRITKLTINGIIITGVASLLYFLGGQFSPNTTYAIEEKIVTVIIESPVLERIAVCESGNSHYNKSGQVVVNVNSNGSYDMGIFQINSLWNKKATELGLDLSIEKDNREMAKWIYQNRGTEDWYSSKKCWQV